MRRKAFLKLPDRYTGWLGEDCYKAEGRRYIKRLEHRAIRHKARTDLKEECDDVYICIDRESRSRNYSRGN